MVRRSIHTRPATTVQIMVGGHTVSFCGALGRADAIFAAESDSGSPLGVP